MKARPDCIVCMFRQALNTARLVTSDETLQLEILRRVARTVAEPDMNQTPAALSKPAYAIIANVTGVRDPYRLSKHETNRVAMGLLPALRERIASSPDPLDTALHVAAAGNVIDLGIGHEFDIEQDVYALIDTPFAINALDAFRSELRPGARLLYLGDNAGEIAFDRLLVEQLLNTGVDLTFSVKSGPIINDATAEDADVIGLTNLVNVIETGAADIGVNFANVSDEFRAAFESADLILAKGHGNFETCNDRPENAYFLLKAKCTMVADELGVNLGDIVFKHIPCRAR
jgi:uncharacterized protein with ATP-grasp and redox domains